MTADDRSTAPDHELLQAARDGDASAFAELWERHRLAGLAAARGMAPSLDAGELVSEAYLKIYELVVDGRGPTGAFRPYLYRVIRTVSADWLRRPEVADDALERIPALVGADPWEDEAFDLDAAAAAFGTLSERWQAVLWYTEVEGMPPREVAKLLGISPNGVSALAGRAREALQSAWVEAHVNRELADAACRTTLTHLQRYQRGKLTARASREVEAHLRTCAHCRSAAEEYATLNRRLALVLAGIFVGGGAASLISGVLGAAPAQAAALATAGGGATVGGAGAGVAAVTGGTLSAGALGTAFGGALLTGTAAVAAVAVSAAVLTGFTAPATGAGGPSAAADTDADAEPAADAEPHAPRDRSDAATRAEEDPALGRDGEALTVEPVPDEAAEPAEPAETAADPATAPARGAAPGHGSDPDPETPEPEPDPEPPEVGPADPEPDPLLDPALAAGFAWADARFGPGSASLHGRANARGTIDVRVTPAGAAEAIASLERLRTRWHHRWWTTSDLAARPEFASVDLAAATVEVRLTADDGRHSAWEVVDLSGAAGCAR